MSRKPAKSKKKEPSAARRAGRRVSLIGAVLFLAMSFTGNWYSHHSREWLDQRDRALPSFVTSTLLAFGDRCGMITDALGWTGHDAVYEFDEPAPAGNVFFAGIPKRKAAPAPADVTVLHRGEFAVGWSPSLKHPVWAAYHVPREVKHESGKRPSFRKDRSVPSAPAASAYDRTGYDRGHMVPNRAIVTRFGPEEQAKTFLMSNISPQRPALNRGPWREVEMRICDLWTAKYGELWVIVGAYGSSGEKLNGTNVDVPEQFYMLIVGQDGDGIRLLCLLMDQGIRYGAFPVHNIVTLEELEKRTGFEFFPELPEFIRNPLSCDLPTRLWPVRLVDIFQLLLIRFA